MQGQLTGEGQSLQQGCSLGFGPRERRGWAPGTREGQAASSQEQLVSMSVMPKFPSCLLLSLACLLHGCPSVITHCSGPAGPLFWGHKAQEAEA